MITPLETTAADPGTLTLSFVLGALVTAFGVGHYRGWHKGGLLRLPFDSIHFAPAWWGGAMLTLGVASALATLSPWFALLGVLAVPMILIGFVALFWLPDRLLPAWYLDWRARGRPAGEVMGKADRRIIERNAATMERRRVRKAAREAARKESR